MALCFLLGSHGLIPAATHLCAGGRGEFLAKAEAIDTIASAQQCLSDLSAFVSELEAVTGGSVVSLKSLGAEILGRKYETEFSSYVYEKPGEITLGEVGFIRLCDASCWL